MAIESLQFRFARELPKTNGMIGTGRGEAIIIDERNGGYCAAGDRKSLRFAFRFQLPPANGSIATT